MSAHRILVTGSRNWSDRATVVAALQPYALAFPGAMLVHGDCPTGLDRIAAEYWAAWRFPIEAHPAQWDVFGKNAGPIRNKHMVSLGASVCLGFPIGTSLGTRGCMELAVAAGILTLEIKSRP